MRTPNSFTTNRRNSQELDLQSLEQIVGGHMMMGNGMMMPAGTPTVMLNSMPHVPGIGPDELAVNIARG